MRSGSKQSAGPPGGPVDLRHGHGRLLLSTPPDRRSGGEERAHEVAYQAAGLGGGDLRRPLRSPPVERATDRELVHPVAVALQLDVRLSAASAAWVPLSLLQMLPDYAWVVLGWQGLRISAAGALEEMP